jgi:hypothetical protein
VPPEQVNSSALSLDLVTYLPNRVPARDVGHFI